MNTKKEYQRQYYLKNKKKQTAYKKAHYKANAEKYKALQKERYKRMKGEKND